MPADLSIFIFAAVFVAFLAGWHGSRWQARLGRRTWRRSGPKENRTVVSMRGPARQAPVTDAADQLRIVMAAKFEKRRLLNRPEAQVFYAAEKAIKDQKLPWRVMAQVSLGEVLSSPDPRAYSAINSKRVDLLLVGGNGPIAAIEYQGSGHYQGTAPARDAVKKEALRRAGVRYVEITPEHGAQDVAREIARIAAAEMAT